MTEVKITHVMDQPRVELTQFQGAWGGNLLTLGDVVVWMDDTDLKRLHRKLKDRFERSDGGVEFS